MTDHILWDTINHELNDISSHLTNQISADLESCITRSGHRNPTPESTKLLLQAQQHLLDAQDLLGRARRSAA